MADKIVKSGGVTVHTEDEGSIFYPQGASVPAKHAKLINNPAVWAGFDESEETAVEPDPEPQPESQE